MDKVKEKIIFLEGGLCYLRPVAEKDANERYLRWINDEETLRYLEYGRFPTSLSQLKKYAADRVGSPNVVFLAIVSKKTNRHIGNVKLEPINWVNRSANLSIIIGDKNYWHKGIGREAVTLMVEYAFYKLNLHRVSLGVISGNARALHLYKRIGFKVEGVEREATYGVVERRYVDNIRLALLRREYERLCACRSKKG